MKISTLLRCAGVFAAAATLTLADASSAAAPGMTDDFTIVQIAPREFGMDIFPDHTPVNPMGCTSAGIVRLNMTAANYNAILSGVITAFTTGKKIHVWINACDSDGTPLVQAAWISS